MTVKALQNKLRRLEEPIEGAELRWLYLHVPPQPIRNRTMHKTYSRVISILMYELELSSLPATARAAVMTFLAAVVPFVEAYEKKFLAISPATPEEMLRFLMDQRDLSQYDLAKDMGGQPVVSAVLRGKRKLTREHIERLSRHFHMSPAVFYPAA